MPVVLLYSEEVIIKEPIKELDNTEYIKSIEKMEFGQSYENDNTYSRLKRLEEKIHGLTYTFLSLDDRYAKIAKEYASSINQRAYMKTTGYKNSTEYSNKSIVLEILTDGEVNRESQVTEHAVEKSEDVSDHVINKMPTINLNCYISEYMPDVSPDEIYDALLKLRKNRMPFSVLFRNEKFNDVVIEKLSEPIKMSDGYGISLNITLKQIKIVAAKRGAIVKKVKYFSKKIKSTKKKKQVASKLENSKKYSTQNKYVVTEKEKMASELAFKTYVAKKLGNG